MSIILAIFSILIIWARTNVVIDSECPVYWDHLFSEFLSSDDFLSSKIAWEQKQSKICSEKINSGKLRANSLIFNQFETAGISTPFGVE